jgi:hypothetical protein
MATFTLDDLTTPLTREQVQEKIYQVLALVGTNTTSWKPGAVVRTMIAACSIVIAAFSRLTALIARSGFLELAEDAWLALVAWYVYGVKKDFATFAEGEVTLVNSGGGIFALDADDLVLGNATTGKQYRNTSAISLGSLATVVVPIRAVEAGASSTAAPGAITVLVTPLLGVTCTNAAPVVGHDDEEDPALRARCSEKLGSLSPNGPWDAYSYAARIATRADGSKVGVTRVRSRKDGFGNVYTYVATASGGVTGSVGNLSTDLGVIDEAIQVTSAPLSVTAHVESAVPQSIAVTYRVWLYNTSGLTEQAIKDRIAARLVAFMSGQPIGGNIVGNDPGKVFADAVRTAIGSTTVSDATDAARLPIFHVVVTLPAADVELEINEVPTLGVVTATSVTQVAPGEGML